MLEKMKVGTIVRERMDGHLLLIVKVVETESQREWHFTHLGEMPKGGYCSMVGHSWDWSLEDVEEFLRKDYEIIS